MKATILQGDALTRLRELPDESVHTCVTSPPYWGLRDYGIPGQIGLEPTPAEYLANMVAVFREVRRVLRSDGTCWINMGDSYVNGGRGGNPTEATSTLQGGHASQNASMVKRKMPSIMANGDLSYRAGGRPISVPELKSKDLVGMPWRLAFALQDDGWYLRQDIIWHKPNPMPESVQDRCTKAHEYIFLLSKSESYFFDTEAIKEKASGNTHSRGGGVNPKAKKEGQHSRMRVDRDPRHVGHLPGNKTHKGTTAYLNGDERQRTKAGLVKYAEKVRAQAGERKDRTSHAGHPIQSGLARLSNQPRRTFRSAKAERIILRGREPGCDASQQARRLDDGNGAVQGSPLRHVPAGVAYGMH